MYAGVDEAGRGPVLGPLVVAGVAGREGDLPEGVRDSKQLAPERREELADRIHASDLTIAVRSVKAEEINEAMDQGRSLNRIEARAFATVLDELAPTEVLVDQIGPDETAFAEELTQLVETDCRIEARVEADVHDPMVAAASIVAKVRRDEALDAIARELDAEVGSGYPSDPTTRSFLEEWRKDTPKPPPYARKKWATLEALGFGQARLTEIAARPDPSTPDTSEDDAT